MFLQRRHYTPLKGGIASEEKNHSNHFNQINHSSDEKIVLNYDFVDLMNTMIINKEKKNHSLSNNHFNHSSKIRISNLINTKYNFFFKFKNLAIV
jgi:hypothetical protein